MDGEIVRGCVHFCRVLRCSHKESRTEIGLDGIRQTNGSLNLKLLGKSFRCDRSSRKRVASPLVILPMSSEEDGKFSCGFGEEIK